MLVSSCKEDYIRLLKSFSKFIRSYFKLEIGCNVFVRRKLKKLYKDHKIGVLEKYKHGAVSEI